MKFTLLDMYQPEQLHECRDRTSAYETLASTLNLGVCLGQANPTLRIRFAEVDLDGLGVWVVAYGYPQDTTSAVYNAEAEAAWPALIADCGWLYWQRR